MPCTFERIGIEGLVIITPKSFGDDRGWFMETYKHSEFLNNGIKEIFVQDNHSASVENTIRGLHFQKDPHAQGKLVRCIDGVVWDVAVDLRKNSNSFLQYFGLELSAENKIMFYIPPGFAHGFVTLSETAQFQYKCTAEYAPAADGGIRFDDPDIGIKWPIELKHVLLSSKDATLPFISSLGKEFAL